MNDDDRIDYLLRRSAVEGDCMVWQRAKTAAGYGEFNDRGRIHHVHRWSFIHSNGPMTAERPYVLHHCDNPACWRPEHLYAGTPQDNMDDKMRRGRHRHGHLYGDDHWMRQNPKTARKLAADMRAKRKSSCTI